MMRGVIKMSNSRFVLVLAKDLNRLPTIGIDQKKGTRSCVIESSVL